MRTRSTPQQTEQPYIIWIEAECWAPEDWDYEDGNTDVLVTFADRRQWSANLVTYTNVATLTEKYQQSGEYLSGSYFWAAGLVLVDAISRASIEALVRGLLDAQEFHVVFQREQDADSLGCWSDDPPRFESFVEYARREDKIVAYTTNAPPAYA